MMMQAYILWIESVPGTLPIGQVQAEGFAPAGLEQSGPIKKKKKRGGTAIVLICGKFD